MIRLDREAGRRGWFACKSEIGHGSAVIAKLSAAERAALVACHTAPTAADWAAYIKLL